MDVSLWSANLAALGDEVQRLEPYADIWHIDVTDAHFVPGLLFFPDLLASVKSLTQTPFHVHLMVEEPLSLISDFINAGADVLTVHCENHQAAEAISCIREQGRTPGIAISLDVPLDDAIGYLPQVEHVLMMGTQLGVKGVDLAPNAAPRLADMRQMILALGLSSQVRIGADGGLRRHTVPTLRAAGADFITPGSLIFGSSTPADVFAWLWSLPGPAT